MVKKQEANLVTRFITEILIDQLGIPGRQITNDCAFSEYTGSKRPDLLISDSEWNSELDTKDFIKELVAYAEVKDGASIDDVNWKDAIKQGKEKSKLLNMPFFIVTNCKTSVFYNSLTLEELSLNGSPIREFQNIDIFRLIKNKLKKNTKSNNINTNVDSVSAISEAVFNKKLWELANIYRNIDFKNKVDKIDFTIGFITLEYYEEKLRQDKKIKQGSYYWSDCIKGNSLRGDLKQYIDNILQDENNFQEFSELIKLVKTYISGNKISDENLEKLYYSVNSMKPLHGCGFDLFGSVYEAFADKKEKESFGEYFTRRHYTHIFSKLLLKAEGAYTPSKSFSILDPACGTGGFLTESFKVLKNNYVLSDTLTKKAQSFLSESCFYGVDIREENISRAKLNMFLIGDGHTNIEEGNSLLKDYGKKFDYILTNPPYGNGSINAEMDSSVNTKRMEIAFLFKIIKLLRVGGKSCAVIPDGVLENPSYYQIRKEFLEKCNITEIVSLPKFAFAPYTKEKTYAVFFEKRSEKATKIQKKPIWMYIIDNDGLANSDKRFPTKLRNNKNSWMHDEISGWVSTTGEEMSGLLESRFDERFDDSETNGTEWINEQGIAVKMRKGGFVSMSKVLSDSYYNLLPEYYLRPYEPDYIEVQDLELSIHKIEEDLKKICL